VRSRRQAARVVDRQGVIRLALRDTRLTSTKASQALSGLEAFLRDHTHYGDAGPEIPKVFILAGGRIVDFSGLTEARQVLALAALELKRVPQDEEVVILADVG